MPIVKCEFCGKDTYKKPSRLNKSNHLFCSRDCVNEYQKIAPKKPETKIKCEFCGKEVFKPQRFTKGTKGRFCSLECYAKSFHTREKAIERFWKYIDKESSSQWCWLWTGGTYKFGHGNFITHNKKTGAHRFSYEIHKGIIPKGMYVLHTCDVPACVNPSHLFLGTHEDNIIDMAKKNRGGGSKLTIEQVKDIRRLIDEGKYSYDQLVDMFGISKSHLSGIKYRTKRKHIE
jgi:ribosomal protein S27E